MRLRITTDEYDFIIKEFQRSEVRERNNKKTRSRQKSLKNKSSSIPGFIKEETVRKILSQVFKVKMEYRIYALFMNIYKYLTLPNLMEIN